MKISITNVSVRFTSSLSVRLPKTICILFPAQIGKIRSRKNQRICKKPLLQHIDKNFNKVKNI